MRLLVALICGAALAGCAPPVPDSGTRGESYNDYLQRREAELRGGAGYGTLIVPPTAPAEARLDDAPRTAALDPDAAPLTQEPRARGDAPRTIAPQAGELAAAGIGTGSGTGAVGAAAVPAADPNNPIISDEQNFDAVAARETIESDRERLERLRSQYEVVQPSALPTREGPSGPNIVEFALSTTNRVGEQVHTRSNPLRWSASERNCLEFPSPDLAQIEFLSRGGPRRDPRNLDPDGDGFACSWNPAPFRAAFQR